MGNAVYCCKTRLDNYKSNEMKCIDFGHKNYDEPIYTEISKNVTDHTDFKGITNQFNLSINIKIIRIQKKVRVFTNLKKEYLTKLQRKRLLGSFFSNLNSYNTPKLGVLHDQGTVENYIMINNYPSFKYIGENSKNRKVFCIIQHKNGTQYVGECKDNKENGLGHLKSINGNVYKGEFENGKHHGYGYLIQLNGKIYEGYFEEDLKKGIGFEKSIDKTSYIGEFCNGKKQGIGKWVGNDGSIYEGDFYDNLKNGYGILTFRDGSVYKGEWKRNMMDGFGEFLQYDGKIYVGFHKNDKRHGLGFFHWVDGRIFIGNWKNGKQHGLGKYIVDGQAKYGIWIDGERISWYSTKEEAFNQIKIDDEFSFIYNFEKNDILNFISGSIK